MIVTGPLFGLALFWIRLLAAVSSDLFLRGDFFGFGATAFRVGLVVVALAGVPLATVSSDLFLFAAFGDGALFGFALPFVHALKAFLLGLLHGFVLALTAIGESLALGIAEAFLVFRTLFLGAFAFLVDAFFLLGESLLGLALALEGILGFLGAGGLDGFALAAGTVVIVVAAGLVGDVAAVAVDGDVAEVTLHAGRADGGVPVRSDAGGVDLVVVVAIPAAAVIVIEDGALAAGEFAVGSLPAGVAEEPVAVGTMAVDVAAFGLDEGDVDATDEDGGDAGAGDAAVVNRLVEGDDGNEVVPSRGDAVVGIDAVVVVVIVLVEGFGGEGGPADVVVVLAPGDPGGGPVFAGDPDPAAVLEESPAAVVVGGPAEGFVGDPGEALVGVDPAAAGVGTPGGVVADEGGLPDVAVFGGLEPFAEAGQLDVKDAEVLGLEDLRGDWFDGFGDGFGVGEADLEGRFVGGGADHHGTGRFVGDGFVGDDLGHFSGGGGDHLGGGIANDGGLGIRGGFVLLEDHFFAAAGGEEGEDGCAEGEIEFHGVVGMEGLSLFILDRETNGRE